MPNFRLILVEKYTLSGYINAENIDEAEEILREMDENGDINEKKEYLFSRSIEVSEE